MSVQSYTNYDGVILTVNSVGSTTLTATSGNTTLTASVASVNFVGDSNADTFIAAGGGNIFNVFNPNTQIIVGLYSTPSTIHSSTDYVMPDNVQNLICYATGKYPYLELGNSMANLMIATKSGELLDGKGGDDVLVGATAGGDIFGFSANTGNDVVYGFIGGTGATADSVRLADFGLYTFEQVKAAMTQVGADVVLKLDAHDSVTFKATTLSSFTASNFQLPVNFGHLQMSFDEEFQSLSAAKAGQAGTGIWSTEFGFGGYGTLSSHSIQAYTGEQEIYVDPSFAGTGTTPLGLNPFSVSNGVLSITAGAVPTANTAALWNYKYYSGLLTTKTTFSQTYGYFEMKAQLPSGAGGWPAFWLLPVVKGTSQPEIDVLEAGGTSPNLAKMTIHDTAITGGQVGSGIYVANATTSFHTYGVLWDPTHVTWYVDGQMAYQVNTPADMNQPMYMLLNMALGGAGGTIDPNNLPTAFKLEYVHAYSLDGTQTFTTGSGSTVTPTSTSGSTDQSLMLTGVRAAYTILSDGAGGYYIETNSKGAQFSQLMHVSNIQTLQFSDMSSAIAGLSTGVVVVGAAGAAQLSGGVGNDVIIDGGGGGANIDGGAGVNTLVYSGAASAYTIYADGAGGYYVQTNALGAGFKLFDHLTNVTNIQFSDQSGALAALSVGQVVIGAPGAKTLSVAAGTDFIIDGGGGGANINGGSGVTTLVYSGTQSQYTVYSDGAGGYLVKTNALGADPSHFDHLTNIAAIQFSDATAAPASLSSSSIMMGGTSPQTLTGTAGADIFQSGPSADTMIGGGGSDTFYVNNASDVVVETAGSGTSTVYVKNSSWVASSGAAVSQIVAQGTSNTKLTGNAYAMTIIGNHAVNMLDDGGGADTLVGNGLQDTFVVRNAATVVQVAAFSHDTVKTTLSSYTLPANVASLTYIGSGDFHGVANNMNGVVITGGAGNDTLVSGTGAQVLVGGGGNDVFYVNNAADIVIEKAGGHAVEFTTASVAKAAANIAELTYTGTGNFVGYANASGTVLTGGGGNDTLVGGIGNDTLDAGHGNALMTGGGGANLFKFDAAGLGVDRISDFHSGVDHIGLSASGFGLASLTGVSFVAGVAPTATSAAPTLLYDTKTGALYFDAVGGDGHAVQIATLTTHGALAASDFVLV